MLFTKQVRTLSKTFRLPARVLGKLRPGQLGLGQPGPIVCPEKLDGWAPGAVKGPVDRPEIKSQVSSPTGAESQLIRQYLQNIKSSTQQICDSRVFEDTKWFDERLAS